MRSWHTLGRRPRTFVAFLLIGVGWGGVITFICTSSHIWCYVIVWGGVGWGNNVHLHFLTYMMLRYCMSSCTSSHTWCYATVCRLALPHIHDATLLYVVLHFRSSLEQGKNEERQKTLSFFLKIPFRATAVYQAWTVVTYGVYAQIFLCRYICTYPYVYTDKQTYIYIYTYRYTNIYIYVSPYKYMYTYIYIYVYVYIYVCICIHIYIYIYVYICIHICICIPICAYMYTYLYIYVVYVLYNFYIYICNYIYKHIYNHVYI